MSGPSSNAMPAGVVRNSALSFVASAQATDGSDVAVPVNPAALAVEGEQMTQTGFTLKNKQLYCIQIKNYIYSITLAE